MGYSDPSRQFTPNQVVLGFDTPDGLVAVQANQLHDQLTVACWGDGSDWLEPRITDLFGLNDSADDFQPTCKLRSLVTEHSGMLLPRLPNVFEKLTQVVLQQLVSWTDAFRGWKQLVKRFGVDLPGPHGLRKGPGAKQLLNLGYADLVACEIMPKQARLILRLAKDAKRIERLAATDPEKLANYLLSIRGIGDWTVQHLLGTALADPDAVIVGDYGLPHSVSWFFQQKPRSDDEEMVRLLEPYRGNRFRVIALLWLSLIHI